MNRPIVNPIHRVWYSWHTKGLTEQSFLKALINLSRNSLYHVKHDVIKYALHNYAS